MLYNGTLLDVLHFSPFHFEKNSANFINLAIFRFPALFEQIQANHSRPKQTQADQYQSKAKQNVAERNTPKQIKQDKKR